MVNETPIKFKYHILKFFNNIWQNGKLPKIFKQAQVIPIPKPQKNTSDPASYRPISLTSQLGKILEGIINDRLKDHLETNNYIFENQSGFRKNREILDQMVRLETEIREAQNSNRANKKVVCAVFLDIAKAFDTCNRTLILENLIKYEVHGKLYNYCKNFMEDRMFNVKVGNAISSEKSQINGVPQGCILSPTLFLVSINEINKTIQSNLTKISHYADDTAIFRTFPEKALDKDNKNNPIKIMNAEATKIVKELEKIGYKVNKDKTQAVVFNSARTRREWNLNIDGTEITTQKSAKYLGVTFDKHLNYSEHLQNRRKKSAHVIGMMKTVKKLGNPQNKAKNLKIMSKSLLEPNLFFGQELLIHPNTKELAKSDAQLMNARRLAIGAPYGTSNEVVNAIYGDFPPRMLRENARLRFWARKMTTRKNNTRNTLLKIRKKQQHKHTGVTESIKTLLKDINIDIEKINIDDIVTTHPSPPSEITWSDLKIDNSL